MYCQNCGTKLNDDAKFCVNCGMATEPNGAETGSEAVKPPEQIEGTERKVATAPPAEQVSKKPYLKYVEATKKCCIFSIVLNVLAIAMIFALLFLPIFSYEYEPQSLEEWGMFIETPEDLSKYLNENTVKEKFSLMENFEITFEYLVDNGNNLNDGEGAFAGVSVGVMAYTFLFAMGGIIVGIFHIRKEIPNISNIVGATARKFYEEYRDPSTMKRSSSIRGVILLCGCEIVSILCLIGLNMIGRDENYQFSTYMRSIAGVSFWIVIPIVLLIGVVYAHTQYSKYNNEILGGILEETYR